MNVFRNISMVYFCVVFMACQSEPKTTYEEVKIIISTSCAVAGCHDAVSQSDNLDYSSYASMSGANGLKNSLNKDIDGFYDRVLVQGNMPPNGTLTDKDIQLLQAWVDSGYPEN